MEDKERLPPSFAHLPKVLVGTERMGSVLPDWLASASARERAFRFLDGVAEVGCTAFDLAASYQAGGTERLFGRWMRSRRNRDRLFLVGKGAHPYPVVRPHRLTPRALEHDLDGSLRRLGTDRIDLYLVHRDSAGVPLGPIVETLARFVRAGKVRAYGVSNFSHERVAELDGIAQKADLPAPSASSPQFSLVEWTRPQWPGCVSLSGPSNAEARAYYAKRGLAVLAWSPLGRGFFGRDRARGAAYESEANVTKRGRVETLARKLGHTAAQVALAWLFRQPFPVFAVVSSSSVENMRQNLRAVDLELTQEDADWLESGAGLAGRSDGGSP